MIVNIFTLKYKYIVIIERRRKKTRGLIIFIEIFYSFYSENPPAVYFNVNFIKHT